MSRTTSLAGRGVMSNQRSSTANFSETLHHHSRKEQSIYEDYFQFNISHGLIHGFLIDMVICRRGAVPQHASLSSDIDRMETGTSGHTCWRKDGGARRRSDKGRNVRSALPVSCWLSHRGAYPSKNRACHCHFGCSLSSHRRIARSQQCKRTSNWLVRLLACRNETCRLV